MLIALLLWLMSSWASVHGHFRFDGQEPPVSLHLDTADEHLAHHAPDELHQDIDVKVSPSLLAKLLKFDPAVLPLLLTAIFILLVVCAKALYFLSTVTHPPLRRAGIRPPLRAPPVTPC